MPIRDEAINVFMGLPGDGDRLELTYNHGVDSYELGTGYNHIALTVDDLDGDARRAGREGHRPGEAAVPRARGRLADLLRARSRRLPRRADRAQVTTVGRVYRGWSAGSRSSTSGRTRSGWSSSPRDGRVVEAHGRDLRAGARRRAPGGRRAAPARADGARARDDRAVRALLPRDRDRADVRPLATSAIREAANREEFLRARAASAPGSRSRCCRARRRRATATSPRSTRRRCPTASRSTSAAARCSSRAWPTAARGRRSRGGSARSSRRSASSPTERVKPKQLKALRAHVREELGSAPWLRRRARRAWPASAARSATSPRRRCSPPGCPSYGVQGFALEREALDALVDQLAELHAGRAPARPGHQARARAT